MLCDNSCRFSNNQVCQDGGTASIGSACSLGTDCNDCSPRSMRPARHSTPVAMLSGERSPVVELAVEVEVAMAKQEVGRERGAFGSGLEAGTGKPRRACWNERMIVSESIGLEVFATRQASNRMCVCA